MSDRSPRSAGSLDSDLAAALAAVRAASRICRDVQSALIPPAGAEKKDKSPVTVADYASQAVVCARLAETRPDDAVVGEEDSADLRGAEQSELRRLVVEHARRELGAAADETAVLAAIDRGGADARTQRYWTLDPIDGTKGFLRREQYAVALALIEDGRVVLGVLGCPNLAGDGGTGALLSATIGGAARSHRLWDEADITGREIRVADTRDPAAARFCESVESGHSNQDESASIAQLLGITAPPVRMDSQCKYAAVARGDASIYLRMPTRADYREKIWDHAAGALVVERAGGRVSDVNGKPLDFGRGRTLEENRGVVATCGPIHDAVIDAIARVRGGRAG